MNGQFKYLFTPVQLGPVTIKNRIVNAQHGNGLADNEFLPTEKQAYYFAEKAKGGTGLIIMGASLVSFNAMSFFGRNLVSDERAIPGYKRIADMVHENGSKMFAQLSHQGRQTTGDISRLPSWAPSPIPCVVAREIPKEMEREDMEEVIQGFVKGARNVKKADFDGVEVYGAHGYLLSQFLSPHSNKREDEYGGSLENRLRFPLEVIDAVRREVGSDFTIGFRLNGDDFIPGSVGLEDAQEIAKRVESTGLIDYLSVTAGTYNSIPTWVSDMVVPLGPLVHLASEIKKCVSLPVLAVNRINDPLQAEQILSEGHADLIGMCRALLADPELPDKAKEGRLDDIRICIGDNQGCLQRTFKGLPISCIYNATVGYEKELGIGTLEPAKKKKKVIVIGGGPAGMEAARVAALRGHVVTLYEKDSELGGQINLIVKLPGRKDFGEVVRYLGHQIEKSGVDIRLDTEATGDLIEKEGPDAVIVATGSEPDKSGFCPVRPDLEKIPGTDDDYVLTARDVLVGWVDVGESVVIIDWLSDLQATGTAELLLDKGKKVEIITYLPYVGVDIVSPTFGPLFQKLFSKGLILTPFTAVKEISDHSVTVYNVYSRQERKIENVDTVVLSTGSKANNKLYRSLKGRVKEISAVGDCVSPRKIINAVYEAHRAARSM